MKRCTLCNAEYPDSQKFCKKDGKPLVEVPEPSAFDTIDESAPKAGIPTLTVQLPSGETFKTPLEAASIRIGKSPDNDLRPDGPTPPYRPEQERAVHDGHSRTHAV